MRRIRNFSLLLAPYFLTHYSVGKVLALNFPSVERSGLHAPLPCLHTSALNFNKSARLPRRALSPSGFALSCLDCQLKHQQSILSCQLSHLSSRAQKSLLAICKLQPATLALLLGSQPGGDEGTRTPDIRLAKAALSHLSYIPMVIRHGFNCYVSKARHGTTSHLLRSRWA